MSLVLFAVQCGGLFFIRIPPISPWPKSESANRVDTRLANELTGRQTVKHFWLTTIRFRSVSVAYQNNSEWGWSYCRGEGLIHGGGVNPPITVLSRDERFITLSLIVHSQYHLFSPVQFEMENIVTMVADVI